MASSWGYYLYGLVTMYPCIDQAALSVQGNVKPELPQSEGYRYLFTINLTHGHLPAHSHSQRNYIRT